MDTLNTPVFSTGDVARAAGCGNGLLKSWLERGVVRLTEIDRDTSGAGDPRAFTLRRVLQIAITVSLWRLGFAPADAADVALVFTDQHAPDRAPGELYPNDSTLLVAIDGPEIVARVVNVSHAASRDEIAIAAIGEPVETFAVVDLNRLIERVENELNGMQRVMVPFVVTSVA